MSTDRDAGQMMLLAAVVLIVAFLALTVLVARIGIVESEIGRDAANTLLLEGSVLPTGVCATMAGYTGTSVSEINATLEYLGTQLIARGILAQWWNVTDAQAGAGEDWSVTVRLTDGRSRMSFNVLESRDCL